jgi:hypothetical protein
MFGSFVDLFFGCSHKRTSFPITPGRAGAGIARGGTYVACLDCGKEFAYDWNTMRVGEQVKSRPNGAAVVAGRPA